MRIEQVSVVGGGDNEMYGAIVGDIVGSPYEFSRNKRKDFSPLFHPKQASLTTRS